ncbi:phosphoglycolate phosphatase [Amycolatopsis endophytica]|uniref:Phosphoglycolate phosphatase n=1 Tax=Amycolatopsis endophytica TaxID=860233 RepID=A0A853B4X5_9PSEU|nr:HAD family hydrolase [Amycolatopsis endophytica]NYI90089.1 phosphoglycolate phosphatase [Amycolatopsis endophytica]
MTRAVVLDLDGTLVDSAPDIARALSTALAAHDLPGIAPDRVRGLLGGGAAELVRGALGAVGGDPALTDVVLETYSRAYRAQPAAATTVHADAREALQALRYQGIRIGICTNKRTGLSHDVLAGTGLAELVDVVVGIDAVAAGKPDPGHLTAVLTALEVSPADAVYVGDTGIDALTAQRAGVAYRHVSWGHRVPGVITIDTFGALVEGPADKEFHASQQ